MDRMGVCGVSRTPTFLVDFTSVPRFSLSTQRAWNSDAIGNR